MAPKICFTNRNLYIPMIVPSLAWRSPSRLVKKKGFLFLNFLKDFWEIYPEILLPFLLCRLFNISTHMDGHGCPLFNKLHCWLVTLLIFVCCQCMIARKVAELFSFNHGVWPFYAACCFVELSRGFVLCFSNASFKTTVSQCLYLIFLSQNQWPWHPPGQYGANSCPMAPTSGI